MLQPGRKYSPGNLYRYGFNGKEQDDEVSGEGNQIDYGERIYDPRTGRFCSVDPMFKNFPELSTYQYGSNNPIFNIDLDGLEGTGATAEAAEQAGSTTLRVATKNGVEQGAKVIAMKATEKIVEQPGFWSKTGASLLSVGKFFGLTFGTIVNVITPLDASPSFPHGDELYYHHPEDEFRRLYPNDPVPQFFPKPNPTTLPNPYPTPRKGDDDDNDEKNDIYLYRGGAFTDINFTPKEADAQPGEKQGWSTFVTPIQATQGKGGKYQILSVKKLIKLGFKLNFTPDGHVGIVPKSQKAMKAWAASKEPLKAGTRSAHLLTKILKKARVKEGKL